MIEFLKHIFGFCGEAHPSLLTIIASAPILGYIIYKIKELWHIL